MNEQPKTKSEVRLEFVPFPGVVDESPRIDTIDRYDAIDRNDDEPPDDDMKTKRATGWAASGLAGALRRSRRSAGT